MRRLIAAVLLLTMLAGTALAGDLTGLQGYTEEGKNYTYQYMELGTYPYEADGTVKPLLWRVLLLEEGQKATLITEYVIDVHQVIEVGTYKECKAHNFREFTTFRESDLANYMNGEMLDRMCETQDFKDAIIETENGLIYPFTNLEFMNEEYGFPHTKSGSTIENPGEVAIAAAKKRMAVGTPYALNLQLYEDWAGIHKTLQERHGCNPYWTATLRRTDGKGYMMGMIGGNGHISWHGYGDISIGVRPSMRIDLTDFDIVGGSGTLEDPWKMDRSGK